MKDFLRKIFEKIILKLFFIVRDGILSVADPDGCRRRRRRRSRNFHNGIT